MPNFSIRRHLDVVRARSATVPGGRARAGRTAAAVAAVAALLAACAPQPAPRDVAGDRLLVLTTFTVIADIAREVGGEHVYVESVTKVGAEIHGYEPTPDDLRRAADADIILENGLGLEAWFERFVAGLDVPTVTLSDGVEPLPIVESAGTEGESLPDDVAGSPNPHAWMSPEVGAQYARTTAEALAGADPDNAADYRANAERYADELLAIGDTLSEALEQIPQEARVLVTCEGAFSYLARDAGLDEVYLWPVNVDGQASPRRMEAAISAVRDREVPAVFCESTVSADAQKQVAREAGSTFAGVLYVDSLSEPDGPVPTYKDLLTHDVDVIIAGLTGTPLPDAQEVGR